MLGYRCSMAEPQSTDRRPTGPAATRRNGPELAWRITFCLAVLGVAHIGAILATCAIFPRGWIARGIPTLDPIAWLFVFIWVLAAFALDVFSMTFAYRAATFARLEHRRGLNPFLLVGLVGLPVLSVLSGPFVIHTILSSLGGRSAQEAAATASSLKFGRRELLLWQLALAGWFAFAAAVVFGDIESRPSQLWQVRFALLIGLGIFSIPAVGLATLAVHSVGRVWRFQLPEGEFSVSDVVAPTPSGPE